MVEHRAVHRETRRVLDAASARLGQRDTTEGLRLRPVSGIARSKGSSPPAWRACRVRLSPWILARISMTGLGEAPRRAAARRRAPRPRRRLAAVFHVHDENGEGKLDVDRGHAGLPSASAGARAAQLAARSGTRDADQPVEIRA